MRDGNTGKKSVIGYSHKARDLPMRDGNFHNLYIALSDALRPRPSYEGWKLNTTSSNS